MSTGAFYPLPLRLLSGKNYGLSAEHHARICADLVAMTRVQPLAVVHVDVTTPSVVSHAGMYLNFLAPSVATTGSSEFTLTWFTRYFGVSENPPLNIKHVSVTPVKTGAAQARVLSFTGNTVVIATSTSAGAAQDEDFVVSIW